MSDLADDGRIDAHPTGDLTTAPLRDAVLDGVFIGSVDPGLKESFERFLQADDAEAIRLWFGNGITAMPDNLVRLRDIVDRDIAAIDVMLSEQLDSILHHPRLLRLEGSWRGMAWLLDRADTSARLKIKMLNVGWPDVCRDLDTASDFDQSHLFRKIYEEEFGMPGGEPYGLLIVDHEVRHRPGAGSRTDDVRALAELAGIAAAAFAPVLVGAAPALLEVDSFEDLANVIDITAPLKNADHVKWRGLADRADMRFVGVALPRLLARAPWRANGSRDDGFGYAEYAPSSSQRVWMNAAYAFGAVVARAFASFAWPADVRGVEPDRIGGGLVQDVVQEPFETERDGVWSRIPLEIVWNDRQERELLNAGLIPLASIPTTQELIFGAVRSLQTPRRHVGAASAPANANARLSAQINSILCASRFAHHIKMMGRRMVGMFRTQDEIQRELQAWLSRYVNGNMSAVGESRAKFPLVAGQVEVREHPGKPGSFGCIVRMQPHYQLDDVTATFQLVTELGDRG